MLRKLLKYELKATSRIFLPLYAVLIAFAAVCKLIWPLSFSRMDSIAAISLVVYITILIGMCVMTYVVMIQRFYKNLLSDEGYLMFTLPAEPWKHITGKLVISAMWMVASGLAAFASIVIIAYDKIFLTGFWNKMTEAIGVFFDTWKGSAVLFTIEAVILGIVSLASTVLIIYASIAVGHLFNRHRILASLGAFLAINTASQILFALLAAIPGIMMCPDVKITSMADLKAFEPFFHITLWWGIAFLGLLSAGYFALTNYILKRRLNLE